MNKIIKKDINTELNLFTQNVEIDIDMANLVYNSWVQSLENKKLEINDKTRYSMKILSVQKSVNNIMLMQEILLMNITYNNVLDFDFMKLKKDFKRWIKSVESEGIKYFYINNFGVFKCTRRNSKIKERYIYSFAITKSSTFDDLMSDFTSIKDSIEKSIDNILP